MTKPLEKLKKPLFLATFCPFWDKNELSQKIGLFQFLYFTITYYSAKNQK